MNVHTDKVGHHCHYFNNDKMCPFEELGCKFLHTDSKKCKFGLTCTQRMWPFKHERVNSKEVTETNIDDSRIGRTGEDEKNDTIADDGLCHDIYSSKDKVWLWRMPEPNPVYWLLRETRQP